MIHGIDYALFSGTILILHLSACNNLGHILLERRFLFLISKIYERIVLVQASC